MNRWALFPKLQAIGGFSKIEWEGLIKSVRTSLSNNDDPIGLEGRQQHGEAWDEWLDALINNGFGHHYWGPNTNKKLKFPEDRDKIRPYVKLIVQDSASYLKNAGRRELRNVKRFKYSKKRRNPGETRQAFTPAVVNSKVNQHAIMPTPTCYEAPTGQYLNSATPWPVTSATSPLTQVLVGHGAADSTRGPSPPTTPFQTIGIIKYENTAEPVFKTSPEYVIETKIPASMNILLIHPVDFPTLTNFVEDFFQKHGVGPGHRVLGMRVEGMDCGNMIIHIDLADERDGSHILKILTSHIARFEVLAAGSQVIQVVHGHSNTESSG